MSRPSACGHAAFLALTGGAARPRKRRREAKPSKVKTFAALRMRFLAAHGQRPDADTQDAEAAAIERACAPHGAKP